MKKDYLIAVLIVGELCNELLTMSTKFNPFPAKSVTIATFLIKN